MKLYKYIILGAAVVFGFTGCADEGPELVGKLEVSASISSCTPTTASIAITIPNNSDNILASMSHYSLDAFVRPADGGNTYTKGRVSYRLSDGKDIYETLFTQLSPNTTYNLYIRDNGTEEFVTDGALIQVANFSFTTTKSGEYNLGDATMEVIYAMEGQALLHIALPYGVGTSRSEMTLRYTTDPTFKQFNSITYGYGDEFDSRREYNAAYDISVSDGVTYIDAALPNLQVGSKYYVDITGTFYLMEENGSFIDEMAGINVIKCYPAGFEMPTLDSFKKVGNATMSINWVDLSSAYLSFSYTSIGGPSSHYSCEVVYAFSKTEDFAEYITLRSDITHNCIVEGLEEGTTYFVRIYGYFTEQGYDDEGGWYERNIPGYVTTDPESFTTLTK